MLLLFGSLGNLMYFSREGAEGEKGEVFAYIIFVNTLINEFCNAFTVSSAYACMSVFWMKTK